MDEPASDESYCPNCGCYKPRTLAGDRPDCGCGRTPPLDGLSPNICVCPVCGGVALRRYGCWGSKSKPHPHAYMRMAHELVVELRRDASDG